jgi:uncharacterized protein
MPFNFFPKEINFFELFEKQTDYIVEGAAALKAAVSRGTIDDAQLARISELETLADQVAREVIVQLNKSFITPFDREDIHSLTKALDDIIDMMNTIANRVHVYKITAVQKNIVEFAVVIESAAKAMQNAVKGLKDMKNYQTVMASCVEVSRLENISDSMRDTALAALFENEKDPIMLIKWKEIYEDSETVLDICVDATHVIESIMLKQA